jgi:hypothetical protein
VEDQAVIIDRDKLVKVEILDLSTVTREGKKFWQIDKREYDGEGNHGDVRLVMPHDTPVWRAAEYGFDPGNVNTLVDIVICEDYVSPEFWAGQKTLFTAATIAEAREVYLAEITNIKLKFRISTRAKGGVLDEMRRIVANPPPQDLVIKSLPVILERHRSGVQEMDPDLLRPLVFLERAIGEVIQKAAREELENNA